MKQLLKKINTRPSVTMTKQLLINCMIVTTRYVSLVIVRCLELSCVVSWRRQDSIDTTETKTEPVSVKTKATSLRHRRPSDHGMTLAAAAALWHSVVTDRYLLRQTGCTSLLLTGYRSTRETYRLTYGRTPDRCRGSSRPTKWLC